jgi:hypothetical protein
VELAPPWRPKGRELSPIQIWVVQAREIKPPAGEEPIEWILLTDFKVRTLQKALQILKLYSLRWQIEVFHKILKSGRRVEDNQLKTAERRLPRLAWWLEHKSTLTFGLFRSRSSVPRITAGCVPASGKLQVKISHGFI